MRTTTAITMAAIVSAGTVAAIAPTISAGDLPTPAPLIECPPQWYDVGDGYGGFWCMTTLSCPSGTFVDHNANGTVDYGECMIGQNAAQGTTPTWDYGTNPGQVTTSPPATDPPVTAPPPTTPAATTPATEPAPPAPTQAPAAPAPTEAPATTAAPINPDPTLVPNLDPTDPVDLPPSEPTLTITTAEVLCNGLIHVEYDTAANPAPADETSHLIVFNPSANAVDFHVSEFTGQGPNGSFTFEQLGSVDDSYRVFVTVVFDPATPGSESLTTWADAAVAADC
jgi:hypothetical protein